MQARIAVYAHSYDEHMHLLGVHTQLCYWLSVGIRTCASLAAIQLLDWAASHGVFRLAVLLLDYDLQGPFSPILDNIGVSTFDSCIEVCYLVFFFPI